MLPVAANPLPHKPQTSRSQMSAMTGFRPLLNFNLRAMYLVCKKIEGGENKIVYYELRAAVTDFIVRGKD